MFERVQSDVVLDEFLTIRKDTVRLPSGEVTTVCYHHGKDGVIVVPDTGEELVFVDIYRYPRDSRALELPAGLIDGDETPKTAAKRELREETGFTAGNVTHIGKVEDWVYSTHTMHVFRATDLQPGEQSLDEQEFIDVVTIPYEEVFERVTDQVTPAVTLAALYITRETRCT